MTQLWSFEYRFNQTDGTQSLWSPKDRAYKTRRGAEKAADREREIFADIGADVETKVVELVSDGRNGRVAA